MLGSSQKEEVIRYQAMPNSENHSQQDEIIKYLRANLLIQLQGISGDESKDVKLEVLLNRAGFTLQEIADLLGKNYDAVRLTIRRAK
ncbi:MAG TPA: hypothetical protein VF553_19515 [Pyrinomonadaceae bacterium]|jgi:DNA-directed RNA polymerase specialized sigma24 family protein